MGLLDPGPELIILIFVIVILLFGATKIPELARGLGRAIGEFKRGKIEIEREIKDEEIRIEKERRGETVDSSVINAAKALGIETQGKTGEQLKKEISKSVGKK